MTFRSTRGAPARVAAALGIGACALVGGAGVANAAPGDAYTITGVLDRPLYPGGTGTLDLALTNVTANELTVGEIAVSVTGVTTQPQRQCLVADFVVTQLDITRQFTLPANSTRTLTELGVAAADLPRVTMTDTAVNQDGCKGAVLNLAFNGQGAEVGGVTLPPPAPDKNGTVGGVYLPAGEDDGSPRTVGGVHLPGTGGDASTFWVALGGLGLVALGTGSVLVTRRTKGAQR